MAVISTFDRTASDFEIEQQWIDAVPEALVEAETFMHTGSGRVEDKIETLVDADRRWGHALNPYQLDWFVAMIHGSGLPIETVLDHVEVVEE